MSFYRVGQNRRKKSAIRKRPGWDDSVNDLTVYRATPEEVYLRKEAHKSKNHISVKLEKLRKERQKSKLSGAQAQQLAIMKEVLYDQHELQKVLAKTDTMMEVVKDLFGDDPKRFVGFPNVTAAPQSDLDPNKSGSLVASVPDIYTRTEKLSDSVMNQSALNDIGSESDSEPDSEGETDQPGPISYQSKLNLQRFRDFLQEEEKLTAHMDPPSLVSQLKKREEEGEIRRKQAAQAQEAEAAGIKESGASTSSGGEEKGQMMQLLSMLLNQGRSPRGDEAEARMLSVLADAVAAKKREEASMKTPPKSQLNSRLPSERTPPSAMNDTKKLKKTKKCTKSDESQSDSMNTTTNMNSMRQALHQLESEVAAYEYQTGRRPQEESDKTETFSGYTIALVSAVSRLTKYLKETDLRVRTEATLREQLTQDVYQMRTIIDALATDIILTQEEYGKLYSEHQRYKDNTTTALASVNNQLRELRQMVTGKPTVDDADLTKHGQQQQQEQLNTSNSSRKTEDSRISTPTQNQQDSSNHSGSTSYKLLPAQVRPANSIAAATSVATASAALMLSPPVRKTRVHTNNADLPLANPTTQRQTSLVDVADLSKQEPSRSSDPPHLTQTPPVMNTVSVPRPIPLVQTNVNLPLSGDGQPGLPSSNQPSQPPSQPHNQPLAEQTNGFTSVKPAVQQNVTLAPRVAQGSGQSIEPHKPLSGNVTAQPLPRPDLTDLVKLGDETEEQLHRLQELAVEEAMNNPALQELMQTQIAELNRQQEEARQRLLDLLDKQKMQQTRTQHHFLDLQGGDASSPQDATNGRTQQAGHSQPQVSPPISPIPQKVDQDDQGPQGRGIVVSLPMMDLDMSTGSLGSPRGSSQAVK